MNVFETILDWFQPAAPQIGTPNSDISPQALDPGGDGYFEDALGQARGGPYGAYTLEPVHAKADGFLPSWVFRAPPGIGDAPQHVWSTWSLIPLAVDGPGDRPASYLKWFCPQTVANFAMRWQGMPVDGGSVLLTGLYTPQPMETMSQDIYGG